MIEYHGKQFSNQLDKQVGDWGRHENMVWNTHFRKRNTDGTIPFM